MYECTRVCMYASTYVFVGHKAGKRILKNKILNKVGTEQVMAYMSNRKQRELEDEKGPLEAKRGMTENNVYDTYVWRCHDETHYFIL